MCFSRHLERVRVPGGSLPTVRARLRPTLRGLRGPHRHLQPSAAAPGQHAAHGRPEVPAAPGASLPELLPVSAAALVRAGVRDEGLLRGPIQRFLGVSRAGPSRGIPQHASRIRWFLMITSKTSQYYMSKSSFLRKNLFQCEKCWCLFLNFKMAHYMDRSSGSALLLERLPRERYQWVIIHQHN